MERYLMIGGIGFHIISHDDFMVEESYVHFLYELPIYNVTVKKSQIDVVFSRDFDRAPVRKGPCIGTDLLLAYYQSDDGFLCEARGGAKGPLAVTVCSSDYSRVTCYMNGRDYVPHKTLGNLLRLIPIRMILQHQGATFLHASQIAVQGKGILFTAPSGTGKTTQAKLWRAHRGAEIICNDRTIIRAGRTYGFPLDGSEPVCSGEVYDLGAIVVLKQAPENRITRLRPGTALAKLMQQMVFDGWNPEARLLAADSLTNLIGKYPVYLLECTPDENAVRCLEMQLIKDGVIE